MDIIETEKVTKIYRTIYGSVTAIEDVSLEIEKGITGVLGPNGSGKTTLIKLVAGIIRATSGIVKVFGSNPWKFEVKRKISYLPEKPVFPKGVTVRELTKYVAKTRGTTMEELVNSLSYFEIYDLDRKVGALSAGMTQKIGLAYTLSTSQELIILDEPTANLDPIWRKKVLCMIKEQGKNSTILFSTHILHDVEKIANNIVLMHNSKLLLHSNIKDIKLKYGGLKYEIHFKNGEVIITSTLDKYVYENVDYIITHSFELEDVFEVVLNERAV